jgi:hypothetical protein
MPSGTKVDEYQVANKRVMKHTRIIVNRYGGPDTLQAVEEVPRTERW